MRRLYLRIYFAVLASLAAFALAAGFLWHSLGDTRGFEQPWAIIARNVLPTAAAPAGEQQAALERVARDLRLDIALFSADGARLAAVGGMLGAPERADSSPAPSASTPRCSRSRRLVRRRTTG